MILKPYLSMNLGPISRSLPLVAGPGGGHDGQGREQRRLVHQLRPGNCINHFNLVLNLPPKLVFRADHGVLPDVREGLRDELLHRLLHRAQHIHAICRLLGESVPFRWVCHKVHT